LTLKSQCPVKGRKNVTPFWRHSEFEKAMARKPEFLGTRRKESTDEKGRRTALTKGRGFVGPKKRGLWKLKTYPIRGRRGGAEFERKITEGEYRKIDSRVRNPNARQRVSWRQ